MRGARPVNGFVAVTRAELESQIFNGDLERIGAWVDLLRRAAWGVIQRDVKVRNGYQTITLKPRELIASERSLAKDWKWSNTKVNKFLAELAKAGMIEPVTSHPVTILRVRELPEYRHTERTAEETAQPTAQDNASGTAIPAEVSRPETAQKAALKTAPKNKNLDKKKNTTPNSYTGRVEVTSNSDKNNNTGEAQSFLTQLKNWYIFIKTANLSKYVTEEKSAIDIRNEIHQMYGRIISLKEGPGVTEEMIPEIVSQFSRYGFVYQN